MSAGRTAAFKIDGPGVSPLAPGPFLLAARSPKLFARRRIVLRRLRDFGRGEVALLRLRGIGQPRFRGFLDVGGERRHPLDQRMEILGIERKQLGLARSRRRPRAARAGSAIGFRPRPR